LSFSRYLSRQFSVASVLCRVGAVSFRF
jgi:hypothetical protein